MHQAAATLIDGNGLADAVAWLDSLRTWAIYLLVALAVPVPAALLLLGTCHPKVYGWVFASEEGETAPAQAGNAGQQRPTAASGDLV